MSVTVQKQAQLSGHKWNVSCLEFSPNGLYLASGSWDKSAIIWDLRTLEPSLTLTHHTRPITSVSWQCGVSDLELGLLATGSSDNTVALWNPDNGALVNTLSHHTGWVLGTDFSSDGTLLASASWDKVVVVSSIPTGKPVNTLLGHTTGVWTCAFNPEGTGNLLCSGAEDGSLKVWDIRSNSVAMSLVGGHDDRVKSCAWSSNGQYVASSSADGRITIWEPRLGTALSKIRAHEDTAIQVEFYPFISSNSVPLLFSAGGRTCRVWHPFRKRKQLESVKPHKTGEEVEAFSISPDGTLLATGGSDSEIVLSALNVSLDEVDALPVDNPEKNINHGTMLWKKYTRKIIEKTTSRDGSVTPPPDPEAPPVSQNSAVLVGRAVYRQEQPRIEREFTPAPSTEKLTAEPEVMLQKQIKKLRPGSFVDVGAESAWATPSKPPPSPLMNHQLKEARQQLKKVHKTSTGSSASSSSDPSSDASSPRINGWSGVTTMPADNDPSPHSNGFHSDPDDGVTVAIDDYNNVFKSNGAFSPPPRWNGLPGAPTVFQFDDKGVRVQPVNRYQPFLIPETSATVKSDGSDSSGTISTVINIDQDYESGSASSSSYYADIDDVAQEMIDLTRRVQVHKF